MSEMFGIPGIGGSLGECALCGKPFVTEILLGKKVQSFKIAGCAQTLFGHDECMTKYEGKEATDLPPESAIRQAYERQQKPSSEAPHAAE